MKQTLLKAASIAYTRDGASRPAIDKMIAGLGIGHQLESKSHLVGPGQAPGSVAKGESELVLTLISEILPEPGVELAGPLPSEFQAYLGLAAASGTKTGNTPAAQALIKFLDGPAAAAMYKAKGMEAR